jgi:putative selenium metabolism hydrolase
MSSDLVEFAKSLIRQPSPSQHEQGVAEVVSNEMKRLGFAVDVDEMGNVVGTLEFGPGATILLDSHMDTVGVPDPKKWSYNPWGEVSGSRLYGRGAMDMKGPLAASVYGVAMLRGRLNRGKVVVSASVCEELVEGPALEYVAKRVQPDVVIICEATSLGLAVGQRGRAEVCVEIEGLSTHSSRPDLGINAVLVMSHVITRLERLSLPTHHALGKAILVVTDIASRPYPGLSVVPEYAVATFDRRTLPGEHEDDVVLPVTSVVNEVADMYRAKGKVGIAVDDFSTYTGYKISAPNFAPAWFYETNNDFVKVSLDGLRTVLGTADTTTYAFCTNGSGTAGRLGIQTLGFGPGDEQLAHRPDEYIEIEELEAGAEAYAALVQALCNYV